MRIALAPFTLRHYLGDPANPAYKPGISTLLRRVKQTGYDGIEMGTPPGFTHQEYKDLVDEVGLQVVSIGFRYPELAGEDFTPVIEQATTLGACNVMVPHMPNIVLGNPFELGKFIANLNRAGKALRQAGVHLSYHNHALDFAKVNGKPLFEQIVEDTDPAYVSIQPDTHWLQAGGAHVVTWLKRLKGRMVVVHFKDYGIDPYSDHAFLEGTHKQFKEIGEGNLNWPGILKECKAQNIPWCAVEQDECERPVYEAIALSLQNLRRMMEENV